MKEIRNFGKQLSFFRKKAGLSQEALAEKAGLSRNYISLLERDRREPSLRTALLIQVSLEIDFHDLLDDLPSHRIMGEDIAPGKAATGPPSSKYEQLIQRLRKCTPQEIEVISKIIRPVLKFVRKT